MVKQRFLWVDALNIAACFFVLLLHCACVIDVEFSPLTVETIISQGVFHWSVDVFFMLSGYTLITKALNDSIQSSGVEGINKFYRRRLERLLIPVLSWNLFYLFLAQYFLWRSSLRFHTLSEMFYQFFELRYDGFMWFFIPLVAIYLYIPFLTIFLVGTNRAVIKRFILIALVINFIASVYHLSIGKSELNDRTLLDSLSVGIRFLIFPVAGYYFGNFEVSPTGRKKLYIVGLISVILLVAIVTFSGFKVFRGADVNLLLPSTLIAFAVFCRFKYTDWQKVCGRLHIGSNALARFSSLSLGIYLIQKFWFYFIDHFRSLTSDALVRFVIMYFLCVSSVWVIKKIPILNRTL
jgi:surface polysaccharide O-acyltransferase-like enzyme